MHGQKKVKKKAIYTVYLLMLNVRKIISSNGHKKEDNGTNQLDCKK